MTGGDAPPFQRGSYDNATTLDTLAGREWLVEDLDYSATGVKSTRTNRLIRIRLVKNSAGINLLPKRLARFKASGVLYGAEVDGYTATDYERGYPVDEWLPSAGVPDGYYFFIVVGGPSLVLTPLAGAGFNGDVSIGSVLVALTAATSGATTAGRVAVQNITASTQTADYSQLLLQSENYVGRALSAKTTANTNADLLVDVGKW